MPKYIVKEDVTFENYMSFEWVPITIPAGTVIELEEINGN